MTLKALEVINKITHLCLKKESKDTILISNNRRNYKVKKLSTKNRI